MYDVWRQTRSHSSTKTKESGSDQIALFVFICVVYQKKLHASPLKYTADYTWLWRFSVFWVVDISKVLILSKLDWLEMRKDV